MVDVFIFEVEDIDSDWWQSEVAVVAESRQAAYRRLRDCGLHKKQIQNAGRPVRTEPLTDWETLAKNPAAVLRRQGDHAGWGAWEQVPDGLSLDWRISGKAQRAHPQR
jgi:hypothetical protein